MLTPSPRAWQRRRMDVSLGSRVEQRGELGITVGETNGRPRLREADFQIEMPSAVEVDVLDLLDIAMRGRLDLEQQQANVLLAEDLDEGHRLVEFDGELHVAFGASNRQRTQ